MNTAQNSKLERWEKRLLEVAWISGVGDDESVREPMNGPLAHNESQRWENGVSALPRISVVDDDESVREAIHDLMDSMGLRTEVFSSAEEFLNSGRLHHTTCLIVDVRMPGMSGLELQSHLNATGSQVPIIFISAHDDGEAQARALGAGAVDFLKKPFSEDALLKALRACAKTKGNVTDDLG
jgi:FixJ family two-component response regulator